VLVLAIAASTVFAAGTGVGYIAAMRAGPARAFAVAEAAGVPTAGAPLDTPAVHTAGWRQVTWY
jgi:hypothetical protein